MLGPPAAVPAGGAPAAVVRAGAGWWRGEGVRAVLRADRPSELGALLATVEREAMAGGFCVGVVAYEAAAAFEVAASLPAWRAATPLAAFVVFAGRRRLRSLPSLPSPPAALDWRAGIDEASYARGIARIKEAIAAGDVYQVNYTYRLRARFAGQPWLLFHQFMAAGAPPHAGYLDLGELAVCSASPELFFSLRGERLRSRPMKGTAPRGRWWEEDLEAGLRLQRSPKERAENLMIVDMARNDLGRVAVPGSVRTPELFALERYPTLWQLTSTVEARSRASLLELFRALFPAASITGAPKSSALRLIAELEGEPRGVYTGAFGWVGPGRRASFNVAIRTAVVDRRRQLAEYGTGGGVVWDSAAPAELAESRLKTLVLVAAPAAFELLETMRWTPRRGFHLLAAHLLRMERSAGYFGFRWDARRARAALMAAVDPAPAAPRRLRLLLARGGRLRVESEPLPPPPRLGDGSRRPRRVALAPEPIDASDPLLFHKTTRRGVYEAARAALPSCDDALLWNRDREVTESTVANLVVRLDGALVTPPLSSGLLPGTFRERLLARRRVVERVVRREDLARASGLWLVSSVRGWVPAELVEGAAGNEPPASV